MTSNPEPDFVVLASRKCPFLGLLEDEKTWSATDQMQNYCHFKRPEAVDWTFQCQYCFSDAYTTCPTYTTPVNASKFGPWKQNFQVKFRLPLLILLAVTVLIVIGVGVWNAGIPPLFKPAAASPVETNSIVVPVSLVSTPTSTRLLVMATALPSSTAASKLEPSPTATVTATVRNTLPPEPSQTPSATVYVKPTFGPGLKTPFGTQQIFIAHQVSAGESLEMLAKVYDTTEVVLRTVNNLKPDAVLWLDVNIVILPGLKDAAGIQPRKAIYVEWSTTVPELAEKHKVTEEQLRADNGLSSDDAIPGKRWFVIPLVP